MSKVIASIVCAVTMSLASAAYAVDVANQDDRDHEITVSIGEAAPVTFKLKAGESMTDICRGESCVLMLDETAWETGGDEAFVIREGNLLSQTRG